MVGRTPSPLIPKKKLVNRSTARKTAAKRAAEEESVASRSRKRHRRGIQPSAPQQQLSTEDKRAIRRRRQRRRAIVRVILVAALGTLAVMTWLNWDVLAPDKLWVKMQDMVGGGVGSYPVDLSGTGARRLEQIDHYTVLLTDSHLTYLNEEGAEVSRFSCAYADALLCTEGKYVLAAEQKGNRLFLSTRNKTVLSLTTEQSIRAVSLNSHGQIAVLTDGPQGYAVQLNVYDKNGKVIYTRSSNRNVMDVALSPNGKTAGLLSVEATDGTLSTRLEMCSLTSSATDALCMYTAEDFLCRAEYLSDGTLIAVSDEGVVLMDGDEGKTVTYQPADMRVLGYAVGGNTVALALRPYGDTAGGSVDVISVKGEAKCSIPFAGEFRHLSGYNGQYALLTDGVVQTFTAAGAGDKVTVQADGRQAIYNGKQTILMGLNRLEAYTGNEE